MSRTGREGVGLSYQYLQVRNEGGVAVITLDRPPMNVLTIDMIEELVDALRWADSQPSALVLLEAKGKAFSAGVDVADHTADKVERMITVFDEIFYTMHRIDKPIVAAVNGAALGGGCELVLFCDLILASDKAKFGQPEISVGVFPPIACYLLPRLLPWPRAIELLLTGQVCTAAQVEQWGLVNRVFPADTFAQGVSDFLRQLLDQSPVVLALTKKAVRVGLGKGFADGLRDIDHIYLQELMQTRDAHEGLEAFMAKRRPVWQGK